jgi:hypothetical protein
MEAAGEDGEVEEVPRPDFSELPTQVPHTIGA